MKRIFPITALCLPLLIVACTADDHAADASNGAAEAAHLQTVQLHDEGPDHHILFTVGDVEWRAAPASLERGAEVAVLEGNPGEEGIFTMRIRMPDGFHIAPHWHPNVERVTVLSGTFLLGSGEVADRDRVERLEAGSYTSMPPGMRHYAFAEGETVIQLTSVGPWVINYINPEDDPRQRE
jgi:quercetin dioxygenase-like cupin family protein